MSKTAKILLAIVFATIFANPTNGFEDTYEIPGDDTIFPEEGETFASSTSNCGGVIRGTSSAIYLSYKPFSNALPNERCVWVVAAFNQNVNISTSYSITARYLGFPVADRHLSYATITKGSRTVNHYYPASLGSAVAAAGHVLIVTFSTPPDTGNSSSIGQGFSIDITSTAFTTVVNASSRFEILNTDDHFHSHPPNGGDYSDLELSVLVFPPTSYDIGQFRRQVVLTKEISAESCCDWIEVLLFSASTNSWIYSGRVRGIGSANTERISHDDTILLAFNSDGGGVGKGFEFISLTA